MFSVYLGNGDGLRGCSRLGIGCKRKFDSELTSKRIERWVDVNMLFCTHSTIGSYSIVDAADAGTSTIGYGELAFGYLVLHYDNVW